MRRPTIVQWHRQRVARPVAAAAARSAPAAALSDARELMVRPKFRRAVVAAVVFVVATSVSLGFGGIHAKHTVTRNGVRLVEPDRPHQFWSALGIVVVLIAGTLTVRLVADEVARLARLRGSPAAASGLRIGIQIVGYLVVLVVLLGLLNVRVESVLLSGAIVSVVLGLAAQQSLSNLFAGVVLLVSRPFVVGDYITLRAGALGGQYDGEVVAISLMFTTLITSDGPMLMPNSAVLAAATGRRDRPDQPHLLH